MLSGLWAQEVGTCYGCALIRLCVYSRQSPMDPRQPEVDGRGIARSKRPSSEEPPESLGSRHDMRFEDLRERHRQMRHQLQVIHVRPIHVDFLSISDTTQLFMCCYSH